MALRKTDIEVITSRLLKRETAKAIATSFGVSVGDLHQFCYAHDINIRQLRGKPKVKLSYVREYDPEKEEERKKLKAESLKVAAAKREERHRRLLAIVEMRCKGASLDEIAAKYGRTREAVRLALNNYNKTAKNPALQVKLKRPPSPKVAARRQKVVDLVQKGMSRAEIASKLGVSVAVVTQDLIVYNKKAKNSVGSFLIRSDAKIGDNDKQNIVKMRQSGVEVNYIADKYGVTIGRIYHILTEAGFDTYAR